MKMLDKLPNSWQVQVQEAYNLVYAETMVSPDILTLPWSWYKMFAKEVDDPSLSYRDTDPLRFNGMYVAFGFVESPICSVRMDVRIRPVQIDIKNVAKRLGGEVKGKVQAKSGYFGALSVTKYQVKNES